MSSALKAITALTLVMAAIVSDWIVSELFARHDSLIEIAGALGTAVAVAAAGVAMLYAWLGPAMMNRVVRATTIVCFIGLAASIARSVTLPSAPLSLPVRLGGAVGALTVAAILAWRLQAASADRLMRAIAAASVAFIFFPPAYRLLFASVSSWPTPPPADAPVPSQRQAVFFLLLDELGYAAAAPIASDLQNVGLKVRYEALIPAGPNTINAIPAMFSGRPFLRARPCGISSVCSGTDLLDFSRMHALVTPMHVTGLLLPYCDIRGLATCLPSISTREHGSIHRALLAFLIDRFGVRVPPWLQAPPQPGLPRRALQRQREFIDTSAFWRDGGAMYAHVALPHPPGLDLTSTLDADYAANIEAARELVINYANRLRARFGERFLLVVTSDHPLRGHWCSWGLYAGRDCRVRALYRDDKVPLIVAGIAEPPGIPSASGRDVYQLLGWHWHAPPAVSN